MVPTNIAVEKEITKHLNEVSFTKSSRELIFIDGLDKETIDEYIVNNIGIANDTVIFVNGLYQTKDTFKLWESIKELKQVKVTMDLFYCGLVFFRREQVEQHFKIRI